MSNDEIVRLILVSVGSGAWAVLSEGRRRRAAKQAAHDREISAEKTYLFWRKLGRLWGHIRANRAARPLVRWVERRLPEGKLKRILFLTWN